MALVSKKKGRELEPQEVNAIAAELKRLEGLLCHPAAAGSLSVA